MALLSTLLGANFEGAQGIQGVQGRQGTTGSQGLTGTQGSFGVQGTTGAGTQGTQGTTGTQGATGTQGIQGRQGITGSQGTTGTQGITGSQGTTGTQGTTGSQGTTGTQGIQGRQGITGSQGTTGTQGTTGSQGIQGITGPVAGSANQVVYKNSSNIASGSANLTFDGTSLYVNQINGPAEFIIDPTTIGDNTGAVRIKGDLYVDGTQTFLNSTTIELADYQVGIATTVATNALLDGAGIGIGSVGIRKTLTWDNTNSAFSFSDNVITAAGKNIKSDDFYANNWFRNVNSGEGLYNEATGAYFASDATDEWTLRDGGNSIRLELQTNGTTLRGSLYADNTNSIGFLNNNNEWGLRYLTANGNSPNLYFLESANETWTGNPGNDEGKIEYHSNRFYVASGANSTNIITFRQSATDRVIINNDGSMTINGNAVWNAGNDGAGSGLDADLLDGNNSTYYLNYNNLTNQPTIGNGTLTLNVSGTGLSGSTTFTANQTGNTTFTVASNATSANTASTIVARDASGNFTAGTITATTFSGSLANTLTLATSGTGLSGSATFNNSGAATFTVTSNATSANTAGAIVSRDGSGNFIAGTITATTFSGSLANTLTLNTSGTGLSGSTTYNNSGAATFTVTSNATSANTGSTIVARDASGNFTAGTITAALSGNASTATTLQTTRTIWGQNFNGSANVTGALSGATDITASGTIKGNQIVGGTGSAIGSAGLIVNGTTGDNDSQLIIKKPSQSSFATLAWNGQIYLSSNIYYDNGAWVHSAPTGNNNNSMFVFSPGTGVRWYASNNGSGSWNVASDLQLWSDSGIWQRPLSNTLTLNTSGTGLSGSTTYNNSGAATFTVTSNATAANAGSTIVARDASGNFSAGTITATLSGNASTATTATNQSGGTVSATTGAFSGIADFTGGSAANPAVRIRSGGSNWSEGLAVHPSVDNGYALAFFRTRTSFTDNTNTWAIGNLGVNSTNNFGLLRNGLTGGVGLRVDSIFDVTQAGVFRFGFNPTVGANAIWHAGNDGAGSGLDADLLDGQQGSYYLNYSNFTNTPTIGNGTLTLNVSGTGLSGSQTFTANQTGNATFTVTSNATSANTASTIVSRDGSGNFIAGTITASLSGNATTATTLQTARTINGVSFNGSANITITANTPNTLTLNTSGTGLSGSTTFNGGSATTFTVTSNATSANTASTIVARDASGNFTAGSITAATDVRAPIFYDSANTAYYLDPANTGTSLSVAGAVGIGTVIDIIPYDTLNSGTLSFEGSAGQLFSITNNLTSGSIFSVNDVSGIPSIDVDANGTIELAPFGGNVGVGTVIPTSKLHVIGDSIISGIVTASRFVSTVATGTAPLTVSSTTVVTNLNADNLDGFTWDSSGKNIRGTEIYADNWFRNYNAGEGLYNEATGCHFVSDATDEWTIKDAGNSIRLELQTNGTTLRGSLYADNTNAIGFLNNVNEWGLRYLTSDGTSPNLYFVESANETWSGDPGADVGKIEYHSNRFYIASGSNSTEIARFRYSGTDRVIVNNDGSMTINGNAVWNAGNDGAGSGLDADLLDGNNSTYYLNYNNLTNQPTIGNGTLTLNVSGTGLSGSQTFTANQTTAATFTVTSNATSANTASTIVARDASGNFTAGTITAALSGNATTATNISGYSGTYWTSNNDGAGSGLDADLLDGISSASFLRSDAADSWSGTLSYGASDTHGLSFQNATYSANSLYIGGWTTANTNGISRIRNSNANLHIDSGADGGLYLNHYSAGVVYARGNVVWHAGNDGAGSGLDADLLDGVSSAGFVQTPGSSSTFISGNSGGGVNPDTVSVNGIQYATSVSLFGQTDGALFSQAYNSSWIGQIFQDYRTGQLAVRGKNNGTWQAWRTVWDSSNDGAGTGLDADLLDGQQGTYYLNYNNLTNQPTIGNGTLTLNVSGTGLSGSQTFTANQATAATFTVTSNATSANTASTIVARDASGNFIAGTITAALSGNATTATTLQTARTINGVSFNGSANITVTANTPNTLTLGTSGTGLSGSATFNGGAATTFTVTSNATSANTASAIVARDGSGNFSAGTISGAFSASADQAIVNQNNGNAAAWYGRILSKNSTSDKASFLGTYGSIAGVFAHNNALNAWADLYINTVDGSSGGTVRMPSSVLVNGSQVWHAGNDGAGSGLDADLFDGVDSLTRTSSHRAEHNLSGGGTITVDASYNVLWSARFIVISNGRGTNFATSGYFDITCPTSGTITGVGGAANKTATAAGIPLNIWEALYYILPIGSANTSLAANFRVASYTSDLNIPHDWVLICVRNGDNGAVTFNNGITLSGGQSMNSIQQSNANTTNTLVRRDASGNFSAGTITATLSGNSTTATNISGYSGTYWTSNNDGAGSGLDADLLDGISSASFLRNDTDSAVSTLGVEVSFYSNTVLESSSGDLATLEVYQATAGEDAFMQFHVAGDYAAYFGLKGDINDFAVGGWSMGATYYRLWHAGNDGSGSGLDADLLDGLNAASTNTASTIVARDASGNFSAGTITASLSGSSTSCSGNAATATTLQTARTINGVSFNGSANITVTANTPNTLTLNTSGTGLSGSATFNGGSATTFTVTSNATSANTASTIVARDASGNFSAGTITASLSGSSTSCSGNAATATTLQTTRTIWGQNFNGSANVSGALTGVTDITASGSVTATGNVAVDGAFRAESSNSTERFEIYYNETTDSLDFDYLTA